MKRNIKERVKLERKLLLGILVACKPAYEKSLKNTGKIHKAKNTQYSKTKIQIFSLSLKDTYTTIYSYFSNRNLLQYIEIDKPRNNDEDVRIKIKDNVNIQQLEAYCKIQGYIK